MAGKYIWIKNRKYYFYDNYSSWEKARNIAKYYRRKNGSRYYILKTEAGFLFPGTVYKLYLSKVMRLY